MENNVCSYELAKKLNLSEGEFIYVGNDDLHEVRLSNSIHLVPANVVCVAPTVMEMLNRLPAKLPFKARATDFECDYDLSIDKIDDDKYGVCYSGQSDAGIWGPLCEGTFPDALAMLLIYLIPTGIV